MNDPLSLPVTYNGHEYELPLRILPGGYSRRFAVTIAESEIIFEQDDQGEIRDIVAAEYEGRGIDPGLVSAAASVIDLLLKA